LSATTSRDFGVYVHVPFCTVRCGYCDFNTYAPGELGGATPAGYVDAALREMELAGAAMGSDVRPASTVFFGGGTPTLLPADALARLLGGVREVWGLVPDAEVTTEANPDSVTRESLATLAEAGFTRVSLGMQSAVPHVLATLERTHNPEYVARAVGWAHELGLATSVDLIYGTPGESLEDWQRSLDAAIALEPGHISAYALVIEPGTKMGAQLRRGEVAPTDPDTQAEMYEAADAALSAAGYSWYEVSNWSKSREERCRHNMAYWTSEDWWGIGPGAHSYLGPASGRAARRWWNIKHPRAYGDVLARGELPAGGEEELTAADLELESTMLRIRLADGIPAAGQPGVAGLISEGLVDGPAAIGGTLRLTLRGRLLADHVVRTLT
jgi:oxygen-independent coproporphyrinogen-3 oxidase